MEDDTVTASEQSCALCSLPLGGSGVSNDRGEAFCCTGCRGVHDVLDDREIDHGDEGELDQIDDSGDREGGHHESNTSKPPADHRTTFLHLDGMHCATCETYIELVAGDHDAVSSVEASYVSDTVRIDHDPDEVDVDALIYLLSGLGYRAYRRDDQEARQRAAERTTIRLGLGALFGTFVMFLYMMLVYPTYFGDRIYGEAATTMLEEGLYHGAANYLFVVIGLMTSVVLFYTGGPILRGAYVSVRARAPNMDLLIAIAALSAYAYSWLEIYVGGTHIYFDVSVAIILVVTIGGEYETRIKRRAMERLSHLTHVQVDEAAVYADDGSVHHVDLEELEPGDRVLVRAGERVPVDGVVVDGDGAVDEAIITGESLPVAKRPDDTVVGGSILRDGSLVVAVGEDARSSLDRITQLVWNLQSSNHGIQKLADRLATIFVPLVLVLAIVVTAVSLGYAGADVPTALLLGLTVLIVSCPCAMGLATPLAVASGVRDALARGIVVFDDTVFERLRDVDVVIFDKTGTLTTGRMSVIDARGPDDLLRLAGQVERRSSHPIAVAIADAYAPRSSPPTEPRPDGGISDERTVEGGADELTVEGGTDGRAVGKGTDEQAVEDGSDARGVESGPTENSAAVPSVESFERYSNGVGGVVGGTEVLVGHPALFAERGWTVPDRIASTLDADRRQGHVPVVVGRAGEAEGVIVVGDRLRDGWDRTVSDLAARGITIAVLTGDDEAATATVQAHPDVDHAFAGVPPEGKVAVVERFGAESSTVMVGDGTNDAPALAKADLGIALGSGTAIAADAADIAIVDDDLATIETAFDLASAAGSRVKQNIGWAFIYNGIAIPLAITGVLNPLFAALAMATSSVLVVTNSARELK